MGWKRVETPNAVYVLDFDQNLEPEANGVNGLREIPDGIAYQFQENYRKPLYKSYLDRADAFGIDVVVKRRYRKGIFTLLAISQVVGSSAMAALGVFSGTKSKSLGASFLGSAWVVFNSPFISPFIVGMPKGKLGKTQRFFLKAQTTFLHHVVPVYIKLRDAIMAERLESIVSPLIAQKVGRKPLIVIGLGSDHAGLENMLKNRRARHKTIRTHYSRFKRYFPKESIRKIYRIKETEGKFSLESIPAPISPNGRIPKRVTKELLSRRERFRLFRPRRA